MNNTFKYILVPCNAILFILTIPIVMAMFLEDNWSNFNTVAIKIIILIIGILLFVNTIFIVSINIRKYDDQEHLRLVERRWYAAANKLNEVLQKLNQDIRKEIIDEVVKNTK